jgi:hypothetical protein
MDIVKRLREFESVKDYWGDWEIAKEAADEIEQLRDALQQIADEGSGWGQSVALAALKGGK